MSNFTKVFISIFVLATLLVASAGPAFAAGEKSITLLSAHFVYGKGVVFTFKVKGDFDSFNGFAKVGGRELRLVCKFRDDGVLSCTMENGGKKYMGELAQGSLNGYPFSGVIKPSPEYCAMIFDWNPNWYGWEEGNGGEIEALAIENGNGVYDEDFWIYIGQFCQGTPFEYGQEIFEYSPPWENYYYFYYISDEDAWLQSEFFYWLMLNQPDVGQSQGDAFYYIEFLTILQ
ncbi:MAG: hypothetical protein KG029_14075 [Bacteroidetes bacterium]|nr:hypothetical protein [Bacteroidota bacterium]